MCCTALVAADLSTEAFPFGTTREIEIASMRGTRDAHHLRRRARVGDPTCRPSSAAAVFDALLAAGAPHGLTLAGYHAMNSLRPREGLSALGSRHHA